MNKDKVLVVLDDMIDREIITIIGNKGDDDNELSKYWNQIFDKKIKDLKEIKSYLEANLK